MLLFRCYSHAADFYDFSKWGHFDFNDQAETILVLYQDPETPIEHQAFWMAEGELTPIIGGILFQFRGWKLHGTVPPVKYDPKYPWFGLVLVKQNTVVALETEIGNRSGHIDQVLCAMHAANA